jgi:uncharacterized membrane protein YphA (DoxX/SURF4 family)
VGSERLPKNVHILVVSVFAITGVWFVLGAFEFFWRIFDAKRYFHSELNVCVGIALLFAAFGLYRSIRHARGFAIFLAAFMLAVTGLGLVFDRDLRLAVFVAAWLFVVAWLLAKSTSQFFMARNVSKTT